MLNPSKQPHLLAQDHQCWQAECMAGWQAGLLVFVQTVLLHMHVLLLANTSANNLQTGHPFVEVHQCWQTECMDGWHVGLPVFVQNDLQYLLAAIVLLPVNTLRFRELHLHICHMRICQGAFKVNLLMQADCCTQHE